MRTFVAVVMATLAATCIQPAVFVLRMLPDFLAAGDLPTLFKGVLDAAPYILIVAGVVVAFPGTLVFLALRRFGRDTRRWLALSGFALAAVPVALIGWPLYPSDPGSSYSSSGNWHGRPVQFVVDSVPTLYGWLVYAENILFFGLHGLIGALVYRAVWRATKGVGRQLEPAEAAAAGVVPEATVYYNSACPVCRSGVDAQKGLMPGCDVRWVDIHAEPEAVHALGLSVEDVRERLVVREADGRLHVGSDAFGALWAKTPGLRWLGRALTRGRLRRVAQRAYDAFARRLYFWNRARGRW